MASTTGQMSVVGGKFVLDHTLTQQTGTVIDFNTTDQFIDKEIRLQLAARPATAELTLTGNTTQSPTWGTATSGYYYPTNNISANLNVSTAGWVETSGYNESDSIGIGKVSQSIMQQGTSTIASGSTIVPTDSNQTITITEGYNAARTLVIGATDSGAAGEITSGSATISSLSYAYDSSTSKFNVTGSADVSAPTIDIPGYISNTKGTKNANTDGALVSATVDKIEVMATLSKTNLTLKPTLAKQIIDITNVTDAANGAATSTQPSSGVYVAVRSEANTTSVTASGRVHKNGYGTTTNYDTIPSGIDTATAGAAQSDVYYIPIKVGRITGDMILVSATDSYVDYNSADDNFDISFTQEGNPPHVAEEGYISNDIGTKTAGSAVIDITLQKIGIQANLSGTGTKKPSIAKHTNSNVASSAATTTRPSSGYYVAVNSAANTGTIQATASVSSAGYGTTTAGQYTTTPSSSLTVGASASDVTYIPITAATFANSATSGATYTDISSTAPALISGDYLYINPGYVPASKISLAKLVPDAEGANAPANYILSGYTAFDNNGALIIGTMATYAGAYTITTT